MNCCTLWSVKSPPGKRRDAFAGPTGASHDRPRADRERPAAVSARSRRARISVFPLLPMSKAPACRRGFKDATTNPATIRRWWIAQPDYNIAIATGLISGVWIFDVDGATGALTLCDLEAKNGNLPATWISITSAGPHFWFQATAEIQSSAGRVGDGCDVRGEGGYVLVPPSIHPDGPVYRWSNDVPIAPAPDWLISINTQAANDLRACARDHAGATAIQRIARRLRQGRARIRDNRARQHSERAAQSCAQPRGVLAVPTGRRWRT